MIVKQTRGIFVGYKEKGADDHGRIPMKVECCTDCGGYQSFGPKHPIAHDALCVAAITEQSVEHEDNPERVKAKVLETLFDRAARLMGRSPEKALAVLDKLEAWAPGRWPDGYDRGPKDTRTPEGAEPGDEKAPFFSESYLYPLMGKDEARTILALLNRLRRALGGKE
jgi:hypothetical protein